LECAHTSQQHDLLNHPGGPTAITHSNSKFQIPNS
jgi:hypothetical protein